mmetsp:Transcript_98054/g.177032  ORF Transcript_98054/g.177032 Transcript_98054/m.177032 type:complete len:105 (+) Transcript_98054:521-835(+)
MAASCLGDGVSLPRVKPLTVRSLGVSCPGSLPPATSSNGRARSSPCEAFLAVEVELQEPLCGFGGRHAAAEVDCRQGCGKGANLGVDLPASLSGRLNVLRPIRD